MIYIAEGRSGGEKAHAGEKKRTNRSKSCTSTSRTKEESKKEISAPMNVAPLIMVRKKIMKKKKPPENSTVL